MINWGIIGPGEIARVFCNGLRFSKTGRASAVASRNPAKARTFAKLFSIPTVHDSYEELLADDSVDVVATVDAADPLVDVVANESKSHATIVRAGQRPGYHFWASDATQGYQVLNPDVKSVTRSVITFPDAPVIAILDKVIKESEGSEILTRWQVENSDTLGSVEAGEGSFHFSMTGSP